jgi:hypothetical protein
MSKNRIILVIKSSDIDISSLPQDKRDIKSRAFKDAVYDHLLKNYGVSGENIIVHIQNDIITIEWSPLENDEYFDAEYQRSMRLLTHGKLEEAKFIPEDLAFRSPKTRMCCTIRGWSTVISMNWILLSCKYGVL